MIVVCESDGQIVRERDNGALVTGQIVREGDNGLSVRGSDSVRRR